MEKKVGYALLAQDIFVNVAGGVRLDEPAVDLGIMAALASSHLNRPLDERTVIFGVITSYSIHYTKLYDVMVYASPVDDEALEVLRITSYNVCYTKLLRDC